MLQPETRFAKSGELTIAYQVVGEGPVDLVYVPGFMSHVELNWEYAFYSAFLDQLADFCRLVILDKRGTGLSDRSLGLGTLEDRMDDLRAVMDSVGLERAALMGVSEGGALSELFSATYPERVTALVLWAAACPGVMEIPMPVDDLVDSIVENWTTGRVIDAFVQHAPDPETVLPQLARFERYACTPAMAGEIMRRNFDSDMTGALPLIQAPTLITQCRNDPIVRVSTAEYLAANIPNARLAITEGDHHASWRPLDYDETLGLIRPFLLEYANVDGTATAPAVSDRVLSTVLFTDIVTSTDQAVAVGDARWRDMLDRHDELCRTEVDRHRGILIKSTGDGILARFDGPGRAVNCAQRLNQQAAALGLQIRSGAHTGEVELRGDDVGGIAVHIAARVMSCAGPGEILVSRTVKDLTAGAGLEFVDRGERVLKGVPEPWHLFAVAG